jgi:large subunit ribosomal protein L9
MKVLLLKDVYKLGHAGDIKKVADGFGRNYLIPNKMAVLATSGAVKQVDQIRKSADAKRILLNSEMGAIAERLTGVKVAFGRKAGETGKLYGSVTTQMICDELKAKFGVAIDRHQVEIEPIRMLGEHIARVRLTVDLVPQITVVVHREGETPITADETQTSQKQVVEEPIPAAPAEEFEA